jgi:hypothetical protein
MICVNPPLNVFQFLVYQSSVVVVDMCEVHVLGKVS